MDQKLNNRQIAFTLFGAIVGYGVVGLPKDIASIVGTEGWFFLLIAIVIAIIVACVLTYLGYIYENKTFYEYSQLLVGKSVTSVFMILYIVYFFLLFAMVVRISSEIIRLTMLIRTPVWAISLLFFIVIYYAVSKGLPTIAGICEFYGMIIIVFAIFIHTVMFTQGDLIHLRPFFHFEDLQTYVKAGKEAIIPFLGMEVLVFIPICQENKKRIFQNVIGMIAFIGVLYIVVVESCLSVIGVDDIIHYEDALIAAIRRVDVPYLEFLSRLDGLFLVAWIMAIFTTVALYAYGTVFCIQQRFPGNHSRRLPTVVITGAFVVSQIPETMEEIEKVISYVGYLGMFVVLAIPMLLLIVVQVRKYVKKEK
ncbi:GerAB/ArcD/ProY family transporter [Thermotalea metallivorans]|uniref:Spore germination protein YndE n=1 Tax=Thermotalea metallivorans TaxID=520762 RepID=A0A140L019_9FIRM|nr:endospore germination permease [Thermotalea metallivorans]KXG73894.1 Spore germination protein YndE [Thermotalea metallivorans]